MQIKIIIDYKDEYIDEQIDRLATIHELKRCIYEKKNIDIEKQILYYRGKILQNTDIIFETITDQQIPIRMIERMNGGKDFKIGTMKIDLMVLLFWLSYIFILLPIVVMIFTTGIIPIIALFFREGLRWMMNSIGSMTGLANYTLYNIIIWIITFIIWLSSILIIIMLIIGALIYPFANWISGNVCDGAWWSSWMGFIIGIIFLIIYGILNIPDDVNAFLRLISDKAFVLKPIINPITTYLDQFIDTIKLTPFYAIPELGMLLEGYHMGIDFVLSGLMQTGAFLRPYDCETEQGIRNMRNLLKNWRSNYYIAPKINDLKLGDVMDTFAKRFNEREYAKMKCDYENMPVWMKYNPFSRASGEYLVVTYTSNGFCGVINLIKATIDVLNDAGGATSIASMIKSASAFGYIFVVFIPILYLIMIIYYMWQKV